MKQKKTWLAASVLLVGTTAATPGFAEEPPAGADAPPAAEKPAAEKPAEADPAPAGDRSAAASGDEMVRVDDRSEARPEPPGGVDRPEGMEEPPPVVEGAGMGSDVAYASRGVVELGGTIGLDIRDELFDLSIAPTVGYFVLDRFELSLIPLLRIRTLDDDADGVSETNVRFAGVLEPSYHHPFSDALFGFVGLGLGVTYEEGPGADFLLRPVAGLDVMVGRSGILKPAGFIDVGVGNGAIGGGFQGAFTVMF